MNKYKFVYAPEYPRAEKSNGMVREHIIVASKALGKPLPKGAAVHHVDGDKSNNIPSNLVICPDEKYHNLLHARTRAKKECGHASWLKCGICKKYDAPENLYIKPGILTAWHRICRNQKRKEIGSYWNDR